jgi:hypothetical protein
MNVKPNLPSIIFAYGFSDGGKPELVISQPDLFDRASVAVHGHPEQYGGLALAQVFGYENPHASEHIRFLDALGSKHIRMLVIDDTDLAESSFGKGFLVHLANTGKTGLVLANSLDDACRLAAFLKTREVESSIIPFAHQAVIQAMCLSLSANPAEMEVG